MAYKFVDADQLDADLTTVADAIRTKGKTSAQLAFPDGMAAAVAAISSGVEVKRATGTVQVSSSSRTVNCGFRPDVVFLQGPSINYNGSRSCSSAIVFSEDTRSNLCTSMLYTDTLVYFAWTRNNTGFSVSAYDIDGSSYSTSYTYVALKITE